MQVGSPSTSRSGGKKVLRVAVVWNGRILEERLFASGAKVGPGTDLAFDTRSLPRSLPLLKRTSFGAVLTTTEAMRGEVGVAGRELELEHLWSDPTRSVRRRGGRYLTRVTEEERGFLAVDRIGLYFDFVEPPAKVPAGPVLGRDRLLPTLVALFFVLGLTLGIVFQLLPKARPGLTVEQLPKRYIAAAVKAPPPPVTRDGIRKAEQKLRREDEAPKPATAAPAGSAREEAERLGVADKGMLGALRDAKSGGAFASLLAPSPAGEKLAGALAELQAAAATTASGLPGPEGTRAGTAPAGAVALAPDAIGTGGIGRTASAGLGGRSEAALDFFRESKKATTDGGSLARDEIDRVVRTNKGGIKYCYEKELGRVPDLHGRVELSWVIGLDGKVESAKVAASTLKNGAVEDCLARVVQRWKFPEPKGGKCRVVYPFTFGRAG